MQKDDPLEYAPVAGNFQVYHSQNDLQENRNDCC